MDQPTPQDTSPTSQDTTPAAQETPPAPPDTSPAPQDAPPAALPQNLEDLMVQGCLSALVVIGMLTCVAVVALASMGTMVSGFFPIPSNFIAYAVRAAVYGVVAIPFGLAAFFLKQDRFRMWRGLALALAVAGLYGLVMGLVLAASH